MERIPETLEDLFKDWHGQYQMPDDLTDWQNEGPKGEEMWYSFIKTVNICTQMCTNVSGDDILLLR